MKKLRNDIILITALLLLAVAAFAAVYVSREAGGTAVITVDGTVLGEYPLDQDITVPIHGTGGENILVIENGSARIEDADCPDRICVNTGAIRYRGETIVCIPHRVTVEIKGGEDGQLDAVSR